MKLLLTTQALLVASVALASSVALAACPKGTKESSERLDNKTTCILSKTYRDDLHLTNANSYVLDGKVFIGFDNGKGGSKMVLDPATLSIEAGTKIFALNPLKINKPENIRNFLVISRGSKILAKGTAQAPIVFTSKRSVLPKLGKPAPGDWGGLFLNGQARSNKCGSDFANCVLTGEAGTGFYGGNHDDDNSGVLRYVRVEFGGDRINSKKEFNGITFNAVGDQTQVNYIQVHNNDDDGVEFFGGTVNVRHLVITGARDDSIDWVEGYRGSIQFAAIVQDSNEGDRGIEADNLKANNNAAPRSMPQLSNLTVIGRAGSLALKLRRGTGVILTNSIFSGFAKCVDAKEAKESDTDIFNNVFSCSDMSKAKAFKDNQFLRFVAPLKVTANFKGGEITDDFSDWFEDVDFIGAIGSQDWTKGWTVGL